MKAHTIFFLLITILITGQGLVTAQVERAAIASDPPMERVRIKPERSIPEKDTVPERVSSPRKNEKERVNAKVEAPAPERHLWGDLDRDGLQDLFVLNQEGNLLFRNLGNGGFEDVTAMAFPEGAGEQGTAFFGDYDGDNLLDLFLFLEEGFILYRNNGNFSFSDVTETLGLPAGLDCERVELKDYDSDGYGDLLVETSDGDRIFRNREGREFGEVDIRGPRRRSGTPGKVPAEPTPGESASPETGSIEFYTLDILYINDNSPGSMGIGVPEVEGGDDAGTQNDIVDGTVTGADISDLSLTGLDIADDSVPPGKVNGFAATLSGDQNFDSGTLFIDAVNHRVGVGSTGPGDTSLHVTGSFLYGCKVENKETSGKRYGIHGESASTTGRGVFGKAGAATGNTIGVVGESVSESGIGVFGFTDGLTGTSTGVYGWIDSDSGSGVLGHADASSGDTIGVEGSCESTSGDGVQGYASASTGETVGVHGWCNSTEGKGILGKALAGTGSTYGVYGESYSTSGTGVYGKAGKTTGNTFGVVGESNSDDGIGVLGFTTSASGDDIAVYGWSDSTAGTGVLGHVDAATGNTIGVEGSCESESGIGVSGIVYASTGSTAGVQGWCESTSGTGVYGVADALTGSNYGVHGKSRSSSGRGVYGEAPSLSGKTVGVYGASSSSSGTGVLGSADAASGFTYGVLGSTGSASGFGVYSKGDMGASGTKSFIQPHPHDPSRQIRFVCLEGNESGTYFRGSSRLEGGRAVIEVPEEFRLVTEDDGLTVQVTPRGLALIGVEEADLERIVIVGDLDVEFDYFVNGVRRGFAGFETMEKNHAWIPEYRDRPYGTQYPEALRMILVKNGILNPDFTPNKKTAARMGWVLRDSEEEGSDPSGGRTRTSFGPAKERVKKQSIRTKVEDARLRSAFEGLDRKSMKAHQETKRGRLNPFRVDARSSEKTRMKEEK
ncbi:MAG: FG-GAP repeat domain-containing protein [Planctomycetota bacterium]|jgi:hypothetical protein